MATSQIVGTRFCDLVGNSNYSTKLHWEGSYELLSQDPIANTSTLRLYGSIYIYNTGYYTYDSDMSSFTIDGTTIASGYYAYHTPSDNGYNLKGYTDRTVSHNSDGTFPTQTYQLSAKGWHFNQYGAAYQNASPQYASGTISGIASIDRTAATPTITVSSIGANSFTLAVSTDANCNLFEYSLDGGSSWTTFSTTNGTSASINITGLNPATTYALVVRVTKTYNGIASTASQSVSTLGYSIIDSIANINVGSSAVVTYHTQAANYYHRIQFKNGSTTLATENIGNIATVGSKSYTSTYKFPATVLPTSTSATIEATLSTYSDSGYTNLIGTNVKTFTLTVPDTATYRPSGTIACTPYNTNTWLNSKALYVGGFSSVTFTVSPTAGSGATVSSVTVNSPDSISIGTNQFRTGILGSGTQTIRVTVTDSRGRSTVVTTSVSFLSYSAPSISPFSSQRGTYASSTWTANESGAHIRVNAVANRSLSAQGNAVTLTVKATINGTPTSQNAKSGNYYYWTGTSADVSYLVTATAVDSVGTSTTLTITVPSVSVPFNINVNIPSAAFGKVAETQKTLEVANDWKMKVGGITFPDSEQRSKALGMDANGTFGWIDGGGQQGTTDYNDLTNKPQINSVTLTGNKSLNDLQIQTVGTNSTIYYGTCASGAAETAKVATVNSNFPSTLTAGLIVCVNFANANSGAVGSLTLNVNGTGAKPIKYVNNSALGNLSAAGQIRANVPVLFVYSEADSGYWVATGLNYNNTWSAMSQTEATTGTATSARLITAAVLNKTIDDKLPTKTSDLTNDSNFVSDANYTHITVDSALSSTSTNPLQNKAINTALGAKAPLASPALTGTPTAPTAAAGTNTTQIATTAFVNSAVKVTGVKGNSESSYRTGDVNITAANIGLGNVNNTSDANKPISTATQTALDAKAPLASPALTGTPTAPTAAAGTNSTQIATTAFVKSAVDTSASGKVSKSGDTMTGKLTLQSSQYTDNYTTGALDLKNSNIQGVNSIYTADASDTAAEGFHFYRDSTHVDSIHANSGVLYFTPNRTLGSDGNPQRIISEANILSYLNTHPENSPTIVPFINNDIAYLKARGGSYKVYYDGVEQTSANIDAVFNGSGSYWGINPTGITTIVIELTLHKAFTYSSNIYVDFGSISWRAKSITIEAMNNSSSYTDTWAVKGSTTTNANGHYYINTSHTPTGGTSGNGFNMLRFTFSNFQTSNIFRIACLGVINYGSAGLRETFVPRDGGTLFGSLNPNSNNTYSLGTSSLEWKEIYGALKGNADTATKATQDGSGNTITATYAPLASPALTGTPTAPTASAGTNTTQVATTAFVTNAVKVTGVKGNSESSYRTGNVNITKANIGLGNVDNTSDANKPVSTATQTALDAKAPLASPALTGTPTAPTASAGTNTTQIATTAFVTNAVKVTGVKGNSESSYRTGNVNITAANIGLGNVNNTSDANKPISTATQTALNSKANIDRGWEYITGTWTATSGTWTGVSQDSELYDGKKIILYMPYAGSGNATLNLTLAGGGTTGAKNCYYNGTSRLTTHFGQYSQVSLIYHQALNINGTTYEGWWHLADYNTTDPYNDGLGYSCYKAKSAIYRYVLLFTVDETYLVPSTSVNNSTATTKALTTESFDVFGEIFYYNSTTTVNANAVTTNWNAVQSMHTNGLIDLRYGFNTGTTLTANKAVYLVCVPQADGKVKLHSTPITQDLPTTNDGLVYKFLGRAYDTYRVVMLGDKPVYYFENGAIRPWTSAINSALNLATVANTGSYTDLINKPRTTSVFVQSATPTATTVGDLWIKLGT